MLIAHAQCCNKYERSMYLDLSQSHQYAGINMASMNDEEMA